MTFQSLKSRLKQSLQEDKASSDLTTQPIPGASKQIVSAKIIAKESGVFCGAFLLKPLFHLLSPKIRISLKTKDGRFVRKGQTLAMIKGPGAAILAGERLFLNLASRLSGVATLTRSYVDAVKKKPIQIFDTRKTTPLWRDLEKFAVQCGGGKNHRFSLGDATLIKDNHLKWIRAQGLSPVQVYGAQNKRKSSVKRGKFVELEAKSYKDVWDGIKLGAQVIMLDNMSLERMKGAILFIKASRKALNRPTPLIEISGGVSLKNVRTLAHLGIDRISVGALTHSSRWLDLSMEVS